MGMHGVGAAGQRLPTDTRLDISIENAVQGRDARVVAQRIDRGHAWVVVENAEPTPEQVAHVLRFQPAVHGPPRYGNGRSVGTDASRIKHDAWPDIAVRDAH